VAPAVAGNAHRPLGREHSLAASLSHVETRQVANDYTIRFENRLYQVQRGDVRPGLRGGTVRVERHLDGTLAVRFRDRYLTVTECLLRPTAVPVKPAQPRPRKTGSTEERLDEELSSGQERPQPQNLPAVGSAKSAQPSSRLLYPKTTAQKLHQNSFILKNQNPQNGQPWARFDWGFGTVCFGASPVAAVFGSAPGSATSPKHRTHTNTNFPSTLSKPDISTLHRLGHFYFALTEPTN
jgi:hypothetical protein